MSETITQAEIDRRFQTAMRRVHDAGRPGQVWTEDELLAAINAEVTRDDPEFYVRYAKQRVREAMSDPDTLLRFARDTGRARGTPEETIDDLVREANAPSKEFGNAFVDWLKKEMDEEAPDEPGLYCPNGHLVRPAGDDGIWWCDECVGTVGDLRYPGVSYLANQLTAMPPPTEDEEANPEEPPLSADAGARIRKAAEIGKLYEGRDPAAQAAREVYAFLLTCIAAAGDSFTTDGPELVSPERHRVIGNGANYTWGISWECGPHDWALRLSLGEPLFPGEDATRCETHRHGCTAEPHYGFDLWFWPESTYAPPTGEK